VIGRGLQAGQPQATDRENQNVKSFLRARDRRAWGLDREGFLTDLHKTLAVDP
jgi:hypothetical protein